MTDIETYDPILLVDKYIDMMLKEVKKRHGKNPIHGFLFSLDMMSGAWEWYNKYSDVIIMASVGWEQYDNVPIDITPMADNMSNDPVSITGKFKVSDLTFNLKKDVDKYIKELTPYFKKYK